MFSGQVYKVGGTVITAIPRDTDENDIVPDSVLDNVKGAVCAPGFVPGKTESASPDEDTAGILQWLQKQPTK